jgi:hypothetical protein
MLNITFLIFGMGQEEWTILLFVVLLLFFVKRGSGLSMNNEISLNNKNEVNLTPDTCPHCKSPNTKMIRLCEWCGNQIV